MKALLLVLMLFSSTVLAEPSKLTLISVGTVCGVPYVFNVSVNGHIYKMTPQDVVNVTGLKAYFIDAIKSGTVEIYEDSQGEGDEGCHGA